MTERSEISMHEVRVYRAFVDNPAVWMTNERVAELSGVATRTVRSHTARLVNHGVLDQAEVFPGHRFRLSEKASKRNRAYVERLEQAVAVFGADAAQ